MLKRLKIWAIHKLGGILVEDLSSQAKELFILESIESMREKAIELTERDDYYLLMNGFTTKYANQDTTN